MRKTISIAIAGQLFHIEEQAYKDLDAYLTSVRAHFKKFEDSEEIVADIESRIAERFSEMLGKKRTVLSKEDIADLIAHMGTVEDFEAFDDEAPHEPISGEAKRLYRDPDDVMIAGVASGIAKYFGIDPSIMRLIFGLSLFFWGAGVLIYIILWITLPVAATRTQKLEMRGQNPTIKHMEHLIRENMPHVQEKMNSSTFKKIVRFPFLVLRSVMNAIGKVITFIVPLALRVIGFFILIGSTLAIAGLTFVGIMLILNAWEPYMDVPIRELVGNTQYYTLIGSGYFVGLLPILVVLMIGSSLMVMRNQFKFPPFIAMVGLWITAAMVTAVTIAMNAPEITAKVETYMEETQQEVQQELTLDPITSVRSEQGRKVRIVQGPEQLVRITGGTKAVERTSVTVEDGELIVQGKSGNFFCIICMNDTVMVEVTIPSLETITARGGSRITAEDVIITGNDISAYGGGHINLTNATVSSGTTIESIGGARLEVTLASSVEALSLESHGGARITLSGDVATITIEETGGGRVELSGTGTALIGTLSGGSRLDAQSFIVQEATLNVSGGARAEVNATVVKGNVQGGGRVEYPNDADATLLNVEVSGHGERYEYNY